MNFFDNTNKMFTNMTDFYEVPMYVFGTKEEAEAKLKGE